MEEGVAGFGKLADIRPEGPGAYQQHALDLLVAGMGRVLGGGWRAETARWSTGA